MYHYTEVGLQNVWLANGYNERTTAYGKSVSIDDADGLHLAIGLEITRQSYLTGGKFRFLRKELDLSQQRVADLLGTSEQTVALWEKQGKIPKTADRMLRAIYLETIDGHVKLKKLIERAMDLDRKSNEKMIFQDTESGWLTHAA
jgi:DNA-binding transcriptional regulator YiaG